MNINGCEEIKLYSGTTSGSWIFSIISFLLLILAIYLEPSRIEVNLPVLWQPLLLCLWLIFASWIILKAHSYAQKFQNNAKIMMGKSGKFSIWENQVTMLKSKRSWWFSIP